MIYTPVEARTETTAAVLWDKWNEGREAVASTVYVNGEPFDTTEHTDITLSGLKPDTEYSVLVRSEDGRETGTVSIRTKAGHKTVNVLDYGAVGDGQTLNTVSIQKAIDACEPGDTLLIPEGNYISGALFLHSDMTFFVSEGARLIASENAADFPVFMYPFEGRWEPCYASLLNTPNPAGMEWSADPVTEPDLWHDITITGGGVIDASGDPLFDQEMAPDKKGSRGRTACIRNTTGLYIYNITLRNSPSWCLHFIYCRNVSVNRVKIYNKRYENGVEYHHYNGDGIDPDSSENVFIFNSFIESGDDSIAVKSGRDAEGRAVGIPSRNIRITHCEFSYGFGVVMGSEMSGGVTDVLVQDIKLRNSFNVTNLKNRRGRGSEIARITYENIDFENQRMNPFDLKWFRGNICIDEFYGVDTVDAVTILPVTEETPSIHHIVLKNIRMKCLDRAAVYICGLPEKHVSDIVLENIVMEGGQGITVLNADRIEMKNVSIVNVNA